DAAALARIVAVGKGKAAAPVGRRYLPPATTGEQDEGRLGGGRGGGGGEAGRGRGSTSGPERPVGGLTAASSTSAPCPSASRPSAWSGRPSRRPAPRRRQRPLGPAASPPRRPPRRAPAPRATCRGPRLARAAAASPRRTRRRPARQRPRGSRRRSRPAAPRARGAAAGWSLGRSAPGRSTAAPRRASHRRPRRRGRARRGRSWPGAAGAPARGAAPAPPRGARWPPAGGARSPRRRWPGWPPRPPWIGDRRGRGTRWRRAASPPRRSWSPAGKRSGRSRRPPTLWTYGPAATGSACPEAILWGMHVLRLGLDQDVVVDDENVRLGVLPVQLDHMDREGPQLELPPLARPSAPRLELWQATEASEGLRPRLVGEAAAGHGRQLVPQEAPERGVAAVAAHRPAVPGHREGTAGPAPSAWAAPPLGLAGGGVGLQKQCVTGRPSRRSAAAWGRLCGTQSDSVRAGAATGPRLPARRTWPGSTRGYTTRSPSGMVASTVREPSSSLRPRTAQLCQRRRSPCAGRISWKPGRWRPSTSPSKASSQWKSSSRWAFSTKGTPGKTCSLSTATLTSGSADPLDEESIQTRMFMTLELALVALPTRTLHMRGATIHPRRCWPGRSWAHNPGSAKKGLARHHQSPAQEWPSSDQLWYLTGAPPRPPGQLLLGTPVEHRVAPEVPIGEFQHREVPSGWAAGGGAMGAGSRRGRVPRLGHAARRAPPGGRSRGGPSQWLW
ncbi:unnamed protein product, partial [Prorocentrum cordatum]